VSHLTKYDTRDHKLLVDTSRTARKLATISDAFLGAVAR